MCTHLCAGGELIARPGRECCTQALYIAHVSYTVREVLRGPPPFIFNSVEAVIDRLLNCVFVSETKVFL